MPDYRLMPDICTLTVRAKKLGIVCPYPMGGTRFNTGSLEQKQRTRRALEQTRMSYLGGKQTTSGKKTSWMFLPKQETQAKPLRAVWGHR